MYTYTKSNRYDQKHEILVNSKVILLINNNNISCNVIQFLLNIIFTNMLFAIQFLGLGIDQI